MASRAKITKLRMNSPGALALLKSPEVLADLQGRAEAIDGALPRGGGEEWEVSAFVGRDRAQAIVKTANTAARQAAAEGTPLQSALTAGR